MAYVVGLGLGLAILAGAGFETARETSVGRSDFAVIWTGSRALLDGGDPYEASSFQATAARYGTSRATIPIETYPPWVTVAFVPLALLDLPVAALVWSLGGAALASLSFGALLRSAAPSLPVVHTLAGLTLFASQPAIGTLVTGQWTFVLVAALSVVILALRRGHPRYAALATLPLLAKPQLFPFFLWATGFATLARRPRQVSFAVLGSAAWLVVLLGSAVLVPGWTGAWLARVVIGVALDDRTTPTIAHWPSAAFGPAGVLVTASVLVAALAAARWSDPRTDSGLAVWLGVSLLLATYIRSYDQLLFVVPLALAAGSAGAASARRGVAIAVSGFGILLLGSIVLYGTVAAGRLNEDVSVVLAAALLGVLVIADRGQGRATAKALRT